MPLVRARPIDYTGWENHVDTTYTEGSPFQPTPDQWTNLPNNSGSTIITQRPPDVAALFASGKVTGREGDSVGNTVEIVCRPTTATVTYLRVATFIGGGLGPLGDGRIYQRILAFPKGQNEIEPHTYSNLEFTLDTYESNGGQIQINPTAAIDIWGIRNIPHRLHKAR